MSRFQATDNFSRTPYIVFIERSRANFTIAPLNKPFLIIGERGTGKSCWPLACIFYLSVWEQPNLKLELRRSMKTYSKVNYLVYEAGVLRVGKT